MVAAEVEYRVSAMAASADGDSVIFPRGVEYYLGVVNAFEMLGMDLGDTWCDILRNTGMKKNYPHSFFSWTHGNKYIIFLNLIT